MPSPRAGESRDDFLDRCIPEVVAEGKDPDQAVAMCIAYYEGEKDKAFNVDKTGEVEYWKAVDRTRESYQAKYERVFLRAISEQLSIYKGAKTMQDLQADIDPEPMNKAYEKLYVEVGDRFARNSYSSLKKMIGVEVKEIELKNNPVWIQRMIGVATSAGSRKVAVNQTTKKKIREIIALGLEQGLTIDEISRNLVGTRSIPPLNGTIGQRARRIARTEIITASNAGSLAGANSTGLNFKKRWLTTIDQRERSSHREMNGVEVDKSASFMVDGDAMDYPGQIGASAKNVINCRCTLIYNTGSGTLREQEAQFADYANKSGEELEWHKNHGWDNDDELKSLTDKMPPIGQITKDRGVAYYRGYRGTSDEALISMNGYNAGDLIGRSTWRHEYGHYMDMHLAKAISKSNVGGRLRNASGPYPHLSRVALGDIVDDYAVLRKNKRKYRSIVSDDYAENLRFHDQQARDFYEYGVNDGIKNFRDQIDNGVLDADEIASLFGFRAGELDDYLRKLHDLDERSAITGYESIHKRFYKINASLKTKYPEGFGWLDGGLLKAGVNRAGQRVQLLDDAQQARLVYYANHESSKIKDYIGSATRNKFNVEGHRDSYYKARAYEAVIGPSKIEFYSSNAYEAFANHIALRASDNAKIHEKYLNHFFPKTQTKFRNVVTLANERNLPDLVEDFYLRRTSNLDMDDAEEKLLEFLRELDNLDSNAVVNTRIFNNTLNMNINLQSVASLGKAPKGYVAYRTNREFVDRLSSLLLISPESIMLTGFFQSYLPTANMRRLLKYMDRAISGERSLTQEEIEDVFGDYPDGDV